MNFQILLGSHWYPNTVFSFNEFLKSPLAVLLLKCTRNAYCIVLLQKKHYRLSVSCNECVKYMNFVSQSSPHTIILDVTKWELHVSQQNTRNIGPNERNKKIKQFKKIRFTLYSVCLTFAFYL